MRQNGFFKRALVAGGLTAIFAVLQASAALGAPPGAAVTASFSSSPATPVLGRPVTFQSISTTEAGHRFVILAWDLYGRNDFKDGTGTTATRTFGDPGTYTVKLFALDDRGQWAIASKTLTVVNQPPLAQFTSSPAAPLTGEAISFTSTSSDPDGHVASQAWDLDGDGSFDDGTARSAGYSFATAGPHTVRLRVVDDRGLATIASRTIAVGARPLPPVTPPPPGGDDVSGDDASDSANRSTVQFESTGPPPPVTTLLPVGPAWLSPFPVVRIRGAATRAATRVTLFTVNAPSGAQVRVICRGRGCGRGSVAKVAGGRAGASTLRFAAIEHTLAPGTRIEVRVTKPGSIGKYTRIVIRRLKAPQRVDACLEPGHGHPVACGAHP